MLEGSIVNDNYVEMIYAWDNNWNVLTSCVGKGG